MIIGNREPEGIKGNTAKFSLGYSCRNFDSFQTLTKAMLFIFNFSNCWTDAIWDKTRISGIMPEWDADLSNTWSHIGNNQYDYFQMEFLIATRCFLEFFVSKTMVFVPILTWTPCWLMFSPVLVDLILADGCANPNDRGMVCKEKDEKCWRLETVMWLSHVTHGSGV